MSTFNKCVGKYIAVCEGDDYWTDTKKLQKQVDFLEANTDYSMCFHAVNILQNGKEELSVLNSSTKEKTYSILDLAQGNFIHTPSIVFRNGLFGKFPSWFNESPVGDYVLHMLNAKKGLIKYFPEPMAVYRQHTGGVWSALQRSQALSQWLQVLTYLISDDFEVDVKQQLINQKRKYSEELLLLLMKKETWQLFLEKLLLLSKDDNEIAYKWLSTYYPQYINSLTDQIHQLTSSRSFKLAQSIQRVAQRVKR